MAARIARPKGKIRKKIEQDTQEDRARYARRQSKIHKKIEQSKPLTKLRAKLKA